MNKVNILGSLEGTYDHNSLIVNGYLGYDYIPIDFIKCQIIKLNPELLLNNPMLDFRSLVNRDTGEYKPRRVAKYKNIKITIADSGFIEFSGSIHKYLNDGIHNYDNFTYTGYKMALNRIYEDFKILPENMWIQNLEFGVNITPPISSQLILNNCFLHKRQPISKPINTNNGHYIQAEHKGNYYFKVYDKAKQYAPLNSNLKNQEILRIEIKQIRWHKYRKIGICTVDDLNKYEKSTFIHDIIKKWGEIIFHNPLSNKTNYKHQYSNSNFWFNLLSKNSKTYYKHILNLKKMNSESEYDVQQVIKLLIFEKLKYLNLN